MDFDTESKRRKYEKENGYDEIFAPHPLPTQKSEENNEPQVKPTKDPEVKEKNEEEQKTDLEKVDYTNAAESNGENI